MVARRGDRLVSLDRHPFVVFLLALGVVTGVAGLLGAHPPTNVRPTLNVAWWLLIIAGSALALVGVAWRDVRTGALIVRAAMWPLGGGALLFSLAVAGSGDELALLKAGATALFGLAALARGVQITVHVRAEIRDRAP